MRTETLIHNLAKECQPVKPLGNPAVRFLKWFAATSLILSAVVLIWGPDPSPSLFFNPAFVIQAAIMLCVSLSCALSAFILTVPDKKNLKFHFMLGTILILWFGLIVYLFLAADLSDSRPGYLCVSRTILFAALPSMLLFQMLKKAAPIKSGMVGLLASLSVLSVAGLGVQFFCQKALPAHILIWHIIPVCILSGIGFFLGRLVFKWDLRRRS
jgi:hypothetical protein